MVFFLFTQLNELSLHLWIRNENEKAALQAKVSVYFYLLLFHFIILLLSQLVKFQTTHKLKGIQNQ